ncbi:hypothetical protein Swol_2008 [Syntrophomonas wolfei subsp. wolfei str. Goettingen G311]|uniref:Uncharacterized protein n=1 Tax=Syntrophomonas wolfei subsp. wolfei (strain DSM 2245B / Goettingen) TaxID=335541 RepID=Q0AVF1_SYNWW|nr:hypothetical protein Swol_2008 [Syntrophomonas wolfei subsp. wolfei str. Goettingen G311]
MQKGQYHSNFYGGALVCSTDIEIVRKLLEAEKKHLGLREIKWTKVSAAYLDKYMAMIKLFFDLIEEGKIKVRIMFTQNARQPVGLTREQIEESYFLLYYQFLKHGFGLIYSNDTKNPIYLRLYLDQLPDTKAKSDKFKNFIYDLQFQKEFEHANIHIRKEDIAEVDSHDHIILQCTDVVLGAMQFRLNDLHKAIPEGQRRRAAKTIAKEKLYKYINSRIRGIYPGFNIGESTGHKGDISNRWHHPYRHWKFVPGQWEYDETKTKHK